MFIEEGCTAIPLPVDIIVKDPVDTTMRYLKFIFSLAHETEVYVTLEPAVIPIKVDKLKRFIAIPPLSAIVCPPYHQDFSWKRFQLAESMRVNANIVTPYVSENPCGFIETLGLPLDVNRDRGIPYICTSIPHIKTYQAGEVMGGGFVEVTSRSRETYGELLIPVHRDYIHLFIRNILNRLRSIYASRIMYEPLIIEESLLSVSRTIASIDGYNVVVRIGNGYIYSLSVDTPITFPFYGMLILRLFSKDSHQ